MEFNRNNKELNINVSETISTHNLIECATKVELVQACYISQNKYIIPDDFGNLQVEDISGHKNDDCHLFYAQYGPDCPDSKLIVVRRLKICVNTILSVFGGAKTWAWSHATQRS